METRLHYSQYFSKEPSRALKTTKKTDRQTKIDTETETETQIRRRDKNTRERRRGLLGNDNYTSGCRSNMRCAAIRMLVKYQRLIYQSNLHTKTTSVFVSQR